MSTWTHVDQTGQGVRMVDISAKPVMRRRAWAEGHIRMSESTRRHLQTQGSPKGPILETARLAGIQAAKQTGSLIPLCHPLSLDEVRLEFEWTDDGLRVEAFVQAEARTGVEMEALTAVSVACLTVYDMCKAVDRSMAIANIRLLRKEGGRSGQVQLGEPRLIRPLDADV
ncbi:MAG: cyclic pyranopterin monophosphate synthase MoaC [Acidobacteria bacterium]|nr:cyclic pyranopterin monophosphate synthase MoaC [Acidobacteriota bacterium]MDW7983647.1 cyclic pyranopterin monophosphate synthase MoaC [Acidobacteriota bacterium]